MTEKCDRMTCTSSAGTCMNDPDAGLTLKGTGTASSGGANNTGNNQTIEYIFGGPCREEPIRTR